jgi:hypothetical protein
VSQSIDLVRSSLPSSEQIVLEAVEETIHGVVLRVRAKHLPRCPACFKCRMSYHSPYARRVRDLPWQGRQVEIHLQTRRFRCLNKECTRKIFVESLPVVAARKARETVRLCSWAWLTTSHHKLVSIHAPVWGATPLSKHSRMARHSFNPRARVGRDPPGPDRHRQRVVSIHAPRSGRDLGTGKLLYRNRVSIHAPRVGRDLG